MKLQPLRDYTAKLFHVVFKKPGSWPGFDGLVRLPTIPHRERPIVSGPSEILLRNATPTLSISERGANPRTWLSMKTAVERFPYQELQIGHA